MTGTHRPSRHDPIPPLEWAAAALGAAIALLLIGTLAAHAIGSTGAPPPSLSVEATRLVANGNGFLVEIEASNASARSAASVRIEGALRQGQAEVETSQATIDYVPGGSGAKGGLIFTKDPRRHRLELRVTGFELP